MLYFVGKNNSTSMIGCNFVFTHIVIASIVGLVIMTCGIIVMVTLGMCLYKYRRNLREKPQHKAGKSFITYYNVIVLTTSSVLINKFITLILSISLFV